MEMRRIMSEQLLLWAFTPRFRVTELLGLLTDCRQAWSKLFVKSGGDMAEKQVPFTGSSTAMYCFIVHVYL